MIALIFALVIAVCAPMSAQAQEPAITTQPRPAHVDPAAPDARADAAVILNHRAIVSLRATLLGDGPAERAQLASIALRNALDKGGPGVVTRHPLGESIRFDLDGDVLFYLVADDLSVPRAGSLLEAASLQVERRLMLAVSEAREATDPHALARGLAIALLATALTLIAMRLLFALRRWAGRQMDRRFDQWRAAHPGSHPVSAYAQQARSGVQLGTNMLTWGLVLLTVALWAGFTLRLFAYTRPWGEQSLRWLLDTLARFAMGAVQATPGLLTAGLIFVMARLATRAIGLFLLRVERGELEVGWLDIDTAGPTRRLGNSIIWLFALAMAYPYLPGSGTDAFKGVSVLAGLMLSLGASGVVGQVMSGLSLMYSRSLRVGEYVKIGDVEGTVTALGMFTTKIHTGLGEEVSLPNAVVFSQPVRNFSRLVQDGQFLVHASVTIGYSTPWRQVHAMLLEAARRTSGVAQTPEPYVMQTALSDFYVEYRLCAQGNRSAPRRRAEAISQLHGNVQDVFNENGVQIMSPHYMADPPQAQIVPPGEWFPAGSRAMHPPADDPGYASSPTRPDRQP